MAILQILAGLEEELQVAQVRLRNRELYPMGPQAPRCHRRSVIQCRALLEGVIELLSRPFPQWPPTGYTFAAGKWAG